MKKERKQTRKTVIKVTIVAEENQNLSRKSKVNGTSIERSHQLQLYDSIDFENLNW